MKNKKITRNNEIIRKKIHCSHTMTLDVAFRTKMWMHVDHDDYSYAKYNKEICVETTNRWRRQQQPRYWWCALHIILLLILKQILWRQPHFLLLFPWIFFMLLMTIEAESMQAKLFSNHICKWFTIFSWINTANLKNWRSMCMCVCVCSVVCAKKSQDRILIVYETIDYSDNNQANINPLIKSKNKMQDVKS